MYRKDKGNQAKPPEVGSETANVVSEGKGGKKLGSGSEKTYGVMEEIYSIVDQLSHHGTAVPRVPGTVETSDFFDQFV